LKEFAKKIRRKTYLRIKESRKTDPRQIAMQEKLKQQRRDAYQKSKERWKDVKADRKKVADEKDATEKQLRDPSGRLEWTIGPINR